MVPGPTCTRNQGVPGFWGLWNAVPRLQVQPDGCGLWGTMGPSRAKKLMSEESIFSSGTSDTQGGASVQPRIAERFRILESIGRGAYGEVLSAWDQRLERVVAIKVLRDVRLASADAKTRFLREMRALASLDHPNIVPLFDADVPDEGPYLVMKLVKGQALDRRIAGPRMNEAEALSIFRQAAAGLAHAHRGRILHRDLKPSNILLDENGHVFLVDFGLAMLGSTEPLTQEGHVVGTPRYMAPEMFDGVYTTKGDIYALGAVLYEMIFREPCFSAADRRQLFLKITAQEPRYLMEPPPDVSSEVLNLLRSLLAKNPGDRPERAELLLPNRGPAAPLGLSLSPTGDTFSEAQTIAVDGDGSADLLELAEIDTFIERLVERNEELEAQAEDPTKNLDLIVSGVSDIIAESVPFLRRLQESTATVQTDLAAVHPRALTLAQISESIEKVLTLPSSEADGSSATDLLLLQFHLSVVSPLDDIVRGLEGQRESAVSWQGTEFFSFEDGEESAELSPTAGWMDQLFSKKEIERYEAAVTSTQEGRDELIQELTSSAEERRAEILEALWQYSDVIISKGRGRSKVIFDTALTLDSTPAVQGKWRMLFSLFRKVGSDGYWEAPLVSSVLDDHPEADRRILARSLLFHPWLDYRRLALRYLKAQDYWWVITDEDVPLHWIAGIWTHLAPRVDGSFMKIFFVALRNRLLMLEDDTDVDIASVMALLKAFFRVDVFHETAFFEMLAELQKTLKSNLKSHRRLFDLDVEYSKMYAEFLKSPRKEDLPIEGWGRVPLPIQRFLARGGYFSRHFSCHPIDPIALECLRHITARENIDEFLALHAINGRLLHEISREARYFKDDRCKYLLVANPKASAVTVSRFLPFLRNDQLKRLAMSHDCSQTARQLAERILKRRGQL